MALPLFGSVGRAVISRHSGTLRPSASAITTMGQEASSTATTPPAVAIPQVPPQTYIHHTSLSPRPKLILIGDSITELGSSHAQGWVTSLSIRYNRRVDVVNRGMNGYNSRWGMAALPLVLEEIIGPALESYQGESATRGASDVDEGSKMDPAGDGKRDEVEECLDDKPKIPTSETEGQHLQYSFLIAYGANDSCLPDGANSRHHVPLEEYSSNLKLMIQMIQTWNVKKHVAVALLTPPPCDTEMLNHSRDNENVTRLYAESCMNVANEMKVPVVDLWQGMQLPLAQSDGDIHTFRSTRQWRKEYLSDGLHLTPMGNYRVYELVIKMLDGSRSIIDEDNFGIGLAVAKLPRSYPDHSMVNATDPERTFRASNR
ncbi:hypothetical protein ACHAWF_009743 [Thalassiosira exigua]